MENLKNKIVLITGGTSGFGLASAKKFIEQGSKVIIAARTEKNLLAVKEEIKCDHALKLDVTDFNDWVKAYDFIKTKYGRLDVLVNCAGGAIALKEVTEQKVEDIDDIISLNLTAAIYAGKVFGSMMKEQQDGCIILFSSVCAAHCWKNWGVYAAAKAGMENFSKTLYLELQPYGVRVSCLVPAACNTNFLIAANEQPKEAGLSPDDIADTVLYIAGLNKRAVVEKVTVWGVDQVVDPF